MRLVDESSNEMVFYRNGVKIDKDQATGSFDPQDLANVIKDTSKGGNLIIGNNNDESQGDGGHFSGAIDELEFIKELYLLRKFHSFTIQNQPTAPLMKPVPNQLLLI